MIDGDIQSTRGLFEALTSRCDVNPEVLGQNETMVCVPEPRWQSI